MLDKIIKNMKHYYAILSLNQIHIKKFCSILLILLLYLFSASCYSQTNLPKHAKLKTIVYSDYTISGYIHKKQFVNGQGITILSLKTQDTIISGNYFVNNNIGYINGVWKRNTNNGATHAKGLFKVSNSNNEIGLTTNSKKADSLQIVTEDIFFYQGFRNKYPASLQKLPNNDYSLVVNYGNNKSRKDSNAQIKLELTVDKSLVKKYGFYAIDDFIYYTTNVKQTYANGDIFIGKIENYSRDKNNLIWFKRKEGKFIYPTGPIDEEELIKLNDGNYKYQVIYSNNDKNNPFSKLEILVNKNLINKYGYWATSDFIYYTHNVKYTYKNGNIFIGKVKNLEDTITKDVTSKLSEGVLKYSTGEKFQGNLSGQWYCGIPISGKMTFLDGSVKSGNWLEKYILNQEEYSKVLKIESPTKKLALAKELYKEEKYNYAIKKAELLLSNKKYLEAKDWYYKAIDIKPEKSEYLNSKINKINELYRKQVRKKELIEKYGNYYGNKILKGELALGMSQEMVNEYLPKKYFNISYIIKNNNKIVIWEFDKNKMQREIIRKGKESGDEEGALAAILALNFMEQLGGMNEPRMLVFKNNKLIEIYKY